MSSETQTYKYLNQAGPGLLFGFVHRFQELKQCLFSDCDSWTLKAEKVLMHGSFLFGSVSPTQCVWEILKFLLGKTSVQLGNLLQRPSVETELRMGISILEQMGLVYLWDSVRDASLCMRFNNCDNDFLAQLSNIKIKVCDVANPLDHDGRQLSVCEILFNDSPLILLAGGMLVLTVFVTAKFGFGNDAGATKVDAKGGSYPASSANLHARKVNEKLKNIFSHFNSNEADNPSLQGKPCSGIPPSSDNQYIETKCPRCQKLINRQVPNPWKLTCTQSRSIKR